MGTGWACIRKGPWGIAARTSRSEPGPAVRIPCAEAEKASGLLHADGSPWKSLCYPQEIRAKDWELLGSCAKEQAPEKAPDTEWLESPRYSPTMSTPSPRPWRRAVLGKLPASAREVVRCKLTPVD